MSDLIEREDAIEATWQEPTYTDPLNVLTEVRDRIESIPTADRPQGEWIWQLANNGWVDHICSVCGYTENTDIHISLGWKYCPNCGAEMRGEQDGNT